MLPGVSLEFFSSIFQHRRTRAISIILCKRHDFSQFSVRIDQRIRHCATAKRFFSRHIARVWRIESQNDFRQICEINKVCKAIIDDLRNLTDDLLNIWIKNESHTRTRFYFVQNRRLDFTSSMMWNNSRESNFWANVVHRICISGRGNIVTLWQR